ncbi:unnamed protein product [Choristocarpus tenellus]
MRLLQLHSLSISQGFGTCLLPSRYRLPFIRDELQAGEDSIVVGHSSGAVAAMRLLETDKLGGVVLVSACHTDLGNANERASGYYSRPWAWDKMRKNAGFIVQFHSTDDPFIPVSEARHIQENLGTEYEEHTDKSHFFGPYEGIFQVIRDKVAITST